MITELIANIDLLLLVMIAVVIGSLFQATVGTGYGMVVAPWMAVINPDWVPGPIIISGFLICSLAAWRARAAFQLAELRWSLPGRILGTAAAMLCLYLLPDTHAFYILVFAGLTFTAVGLSLFAPRFQPNPINLFSMAGLSGLMGTITGIGGPPMVLAYQHSNGPHTRSALNTFFMIGSGLSIVGLLIIDRLTWLDFWLGLILTPVALITVVVSSRWQHWVDVRFRYAALGLAALAACVLLTKL